MLIVHLRPFRNYGAKARFEPRQSHSRNKCLTRIHVGVQTGLAQVQDAYRILCSGESATKSPTTIPKPEGHSRTEARHHNEKTSSHFIAKQSSHMAIIAFYKIGSGSSGKLNNLPQIMQIEEMEPLQTKGPWCFLAL